MPMATAWVSPGVKLKCPVGGITYGYAAWKTPSGLLEPPPASSPPSGVGFARIQAPRAGMLAAPRTSAANDRRGMAAAARGPCPSVMMVPSPRVVSSLGPAHRDHQHGGGDGRPDDH